MQIMSVSRALTSITMSAIDTKSAKPYGKLKGLARKIKIENHIKKTIRTYELSIEISTHIKTEAN